MLFWGKMCYFATNSKKILLGKEKLNMEVRMQGKKLYVGNLNYSVTNEQLAELFSDYGEVLHVNIIEGKGFGFVEMSNQEDAEKAKVALNNSEFKGRTLRVDEARPPRNRQGGQRQRQKGGGHRRY
jgi:RNA recognition motif-containing protein